MAPITFTSRVLVWTAQDCSLQYRFLVEYERGEFAGQFYILLLMLTDVTFHGGHYYEVITTPMTFSFAENSASVMVVSTAANYSAGLIVQINSYSENVFVYNLLSSRGITSSWLSGHFYPAKLAWIYYGAVFYAPAPVGNLTYTAWAPGNPTSNTSYPHCILMNATADSNQSWLDSGCYDTSTFVVEYASSKSKVHVPDILSLNTAFH